MTKDRLSASVEEEIADWVKNHDESNSQLVQDALKRIYEEEQYGKEHALKTRKRELEKEVQEHKAKIEQLEKDIEKIDEELENLESIESQQTKKLIDYAESLISKEPQFRSYDPVAGLSSDQVKGILTEVGIHYAKYENGRRDMKDVPQSLREQDKSEYETGKYGQIEDGEDFRDAYHRLTEEQKQEIGRLVEEKF